ncbi:HAUS augmin-like complex subunit 8 isoform X2 [Eublepharis macularius]|uniref:HAUS augmin-like complex subunit 8 isoform X2 n=1 Tax=Eublepharis macularius TaxID=481883 RepID=A0AA97JEI5_EUBMA|nr:HAUS augmin-like complex subunit 8 isoform X2 [Eublepharis macularius]
MTVTRGNSPTPRKGRTKPKARPRLGAGDTRPPPPPPLHIPRPEGVTGEAGSGDFLAHHFRPPRHLAVSPAGPVRMRFPSKCGGAGTGRWSGAAMAEAAPSPKPKGGRIVPSRYLQYDRKVAGKVESCLSGTKGFERAASAKRPPVQLQKQKATSETMLQSTLLENHGNARLDLEFSAIDGRPDKTRLQTPLSKANAAVKGASRREQTLISTDPDDLTGVLGSHALLLTYALIKMEKNLALLEREAERNLLALSEERGKLQEEAHRKKRRLLRLKKEQELLDTLDRQLEVLVPVSEQCVRFQEEYSNFATALDSTRHELPIKGIHMGENQSQFLADLQEQLTATQSILEGNLQEHSEHNTKVLDVVKELEEASLKLNDELQRSFAGVLNLSVDVSKEVSLHYQKTCEDTLGLEAMRQLYFPQSSS